MQRRRLERCQPFSLAISMFYFAVWVKVHLETIIYQRLKASEAINLNQTSGYDRRGQASESEPAGRMPAHVAGLSSLSSLN